MADTLTPSDQATACSSLEQEVLNEYALLLDNLNKVRPAPPRPSPSRHLRARPLTFGGLSALRGPLVPCRTADRGGPGWAADVGAEDELGVHAVEGERV